MRAHLTRLATLLTLLALPLSLSVPLAQAAHAARATQTAPAASPDAQVITLVCAKRTTGLLRKPAGTTCRTNEKKLRVAAPKKRTLCLARDRSIHQIGSKQKLSRRECRARGKVVKAPTPTGLRMCARGAKKLRWIGPSQKCRKNERFVQFRTPSKTPTPPTGPAATIVLSPSQIAENGADGAQVGLLTTKPAGAGGAAYALVAGAGSSDNADFEVRGSALLLRSSADFETQPSYAVRLRSTDRRGARVETPLVVRVADVNEAPTTLSLSRTTVDEHLPGGAVVGTVTATDPDAGETHTFEVTTPTSEPGADAFEMVGAELRTTRPLKLLDDPTLTVEITATDRGGLSLTKTVIITVLDVNDPPQDLSLDNLGVAELTDDARVGSLSATDPDGPAPLTYRLVAGAGSADNDDFTIVGIELRTAARLAQRDGLTRTIRVEVADADGATAERAFEITLLRTPQGPTSISLTPAMFAEDAAIGSRVGALSAVDANIDETATFALIGGSGAGDNSAFEIRGDELFTRASFQDAAPSTRSVRVRVTDADGLTFEQVLTITITGVNRAPVFAPNTVTRSVPERAEVGTFLYDFGPTVSDRNDDALTFALSGPESAAFALDGTRIVAARTFDFEEKSQFSVVVTATDSGSLTGTLDFTLQVVNVNEAPTDVTLSGTTVAENAPAGTDIGALGAVDPDLGDIFTYSVLDGGPFTVVDGRLRTTRGFDFETEPTLTAKVRAIDGGGLSFTKSFTITVTDVNEAPVVGADTYPGVIGNTVATLGQVAGTSPSVALSGELPTANDTDPEGRPLVVTEETVPTLKGGTVELTATGAFRYTPKLGAKNLTDSFSYRVSDGVFTVSGTVTLTIGNRLIWWMKPSASGDGSSSNPRGSFGGLDSASGDGDLDSPGDEFFVYPGDFTFTGLPLEANQTLLGGAAGVQVGGTDLVVPGGATTLLANPSASLRLAQGATVRHLTLKGASAAALAGTNVNSASVDDTVTVLGGTGHAIQISGGSGALELTARVTPGTGPVAVEVTNRTGTTSLGRIAAPTTGVSGGLNVASAGTVELTGQVTLNTGSQPAMRVSATTLNDTGGGHTVATTTGVPLTLGNASLAADLRFASVTSAGAASGIKVTGGAGSGRLVVANGTIASSTGIGVEVADTRAPRLESLTVQGGAADAIVGKKLTGTFEVIDSAVRDNGGDGLRLESSGGSASLTATGNTFAANRGDHVQVAAEQTASGAVVIANNTLTGGAVSGGQGIVVGTGGSAFTGSLTFDVNQNTLSNSRSSAVIVSGTNNSPSAVFSGRVRNNTIGSATTSCSLNANGIEVSHDAGSGRLVAALTDNVLTGCKLDGIQITAGDGAAGVHATVTGNSVAGLVDPLGSGFNGNFGITSADTQASCLDLRSNTLRAGPGAGAASLRLRNRWGTLGIVGLTGGTSEATVTARLIAANTLTAAAAVTGVGFASATSCATPTN